MGYLKFIDESNDELVIRDVSELPFADRVETLLALGDLESKPKFFCGFCVADVTENLCEHLSHWR